MIDFEIIENKIGSDFGILTWNEDDYQIIRKLLSNYLLSSQNLILNDLPLEEMVKSERYQFSLASWFYNDFFKEWKIIIDRDKKIKKIKNYVKK